MDRPKYSKKKNCYWQLAIQKGPSPTLNRSPEKFGIVLRPWITPGVPLACARPAKVYQKYMSQRTYLKYRTFCPECKKIFLIESQNIEK